MAYKVTAVAKPTTAGQASAVEVPQEVKDDVDGIYAHLTAHPDQEGFAEFDTKAEKNTWMNQARVYCKSRAAGALTLRQLPSKHLPENQVRFAITADLPENGARQTR